MTIPSSGSFKASQLNTELGRSSTAQLKASDSALRTLAGDTSGQYEASDFRGKSAFEINSFPSQNTFKVRNSNAWYYVTLTCTTTPSSGVTFSFTESGTLNIHATSGNTVTLKYYANTTTGDKSSTVTCNATYGGTTKTITATARIIWEGGF